VSAEVLTAVGSIADERQQFEKRRQKKQRCGLKTAKSGVMTTGRND
jgi:hypothetical protein